jgi:hypothetical protein
VSDGPLAVGELWRRLVEAVCERDARFASQWGEPLRALVAAGPLARRIVASACIPTDHPTLAATYRALAHCLATNRPFEAAPVPK